MPELTGVRCLTLDIDDTLYLERDYVRSGFQVLDGWVERELGAGGFFTSAWQAFETGVRGRIFNVALEALGLIPSGDAIGRMVEVYRGHQPDIQLLPDARFLLERTSGIPCRAAVTDGPLASQKAKAAALGLDGWLAPIVFTEALGPGFGKPHPRAFLEIQRGAGVEPGQCLYVADNPAKDFAGPAQLGWQTVRVRRPGSLHESVPSGDDVKMEISDLTALSELLT